MHLTDILWWSYSVFVVGAALFMIWFTLRVRRRREPTAAGVMHMADVSVQVRWKAPMLMVAAAEETTTVLMDTRPESGGTGVGPTPIETVLMALAGCSGMDVVGILRKARAPLLGLTITAMADRAAEHPKVFTRIHLRYTAWGVGLTSDQVRKAVVLSLEKYCSVSAMLRATVPITHEIVVGETADDTAAPSRAARAG